MNNQTRTSSNSFHIPRPSCTYVQSGVLQRACACGQHTHGAGECVECRKKREGLLQRTAVGHAPDTAPPIVHAVLHAGGQPLDAGTRAAMEPRFGHDFSQVRVHADGQAAAAAQAVNALAYTVGPHVVFGAGQYAPHTRAGQRLLAHELTHVVQQSRGGTDTPMPLASSRLEQAASKAAAAVVAGAPVTVEGASAPGLARQERWLTENPNPQSFSDEALEREIQLIRQWLLAHPVDNADTRRLGEVLSLFEQEAGSRPTGGRATAAAGGTPGGSTRPATGAPVLAAGAAVALPALGGATGGTLTGAGGATATTAGAGEVGLGAVISAPLAAVIAFFAVLLYPSSTVSGAEEQRMLEQARQQARTRAQSTPSPGAPNLDQAIRMFQAALAALGTGAAMAISADVIDRQRGRIQDLLDQIEELIRNNPRVAMRCSQAVIAFRQAVQAALDYLSQPPDQVNAFQLRRLLDAINTALTNLLACMNVAPPSP